MASMDDTARADLAIVVLGIADDCMLQGHRDSEWTGLGPILEEDIAFSSMAQDELGHALVWYNLLAGLGETRSPDLLAFTRDAGDWRNAQIVALPRGEYPFSLMRRHLHDLAKAVLYDGLIACGVAEVAVAATKLRQEKKYHLIHNRAYIERLARSETGRGPIQAALDELFPFALGLFEKQDAHDRLAAAGFIPSQALLRERWLDVTCSSLAAAGLRPPAHRAEEAWIPDVDPRVGGRSGRHVPEQVALLEAMQGMFRSDPEATW